MSSEADVVVTHVVRIEHRRGGAVELPIGPTLPLQLHGPRAAGLHDDGTFMLISNDRNLGAGPRREVSFVVRDDGDGVRAAIVPGRFGEMVHALEAPKPRLLKGEEAFAPEVRFAVRDYVLTCRPLAVDEDVDALLQQAERDVEAFGTLRARPAQLYAAPADVLEGIAARWGAPEESAPEPEEEVRIVVERKRPSDGGYELRVTAAPKTSSWRVGDRIPIREPATRLFALLDPDDRASVGPLVQLMDHDVVARGHKGRSVATIWPTRHGLLVAGVYTGTYLDDRVGPLWLAQDGATFGFNETAFVVEGPPARGLPMTSVQQKHLVRGSRLALITPNGIPNGWPFSKFWLSPAEDVVDLDHARAYAASSAEPPLAEIAWDDLVASLDAPPRRRARLGKLQFVPNLSRSSGDASEGTLRASFSLPEPAVVLAAELRISRASGPMLGEDEDAWIEPGDALVIGAPLPRPLAPGGTLDVRWFGPAPWTGRQRGVAVLELALSSGPKLVAGMRWDNAGGWEHPLRR